MLTYILFFYLIFYLTSLYFVAKAYKKYNPERLSISRLGTKKSPYHKLFNALGIINGTLLILIGLGLNWYLVPILGGFLVLVSIVPWDRSKMIHDVFAFFALIAQLMFAFSFVFQENLPILKFLLFIVLAASLMFFMELVWKFVSGKKTFPKFTWLWEWTIYVSYVVFALTYCVVAIKG